MDVQVDAGGEGQQSEPIVEKDMGAAQVVDTNQTGEEGQQEGNDEAAEAGSQERGADGKFKKPGVQSRIDELTRARHEADREAAYWRSLATQQGSAQTSAPAANPKPTVEQFDDYGEYVEALTDWKADQAVAKRMEADSTRKAGDVRAQTFMERQADFVKSTPDYVEVMSNSNAPIAQHVIEAAQESDVGPQLLYHFAQNPDVLARINGMDERQANREIGRLEATLSKATVTPPPAKKITKAPAPASTASSQGRSTTPDLASASMDEYMAQRKAQGARWSRR